MTDPKRPLTPADEALVHELLHDLHVEDDPSVDFVASRPALRAVRAKVRERQGKQGGKSNKPSAVAERRDYRLKKKIEGKGEPRDYRSTGIEAQRPDETPDNYRRRYKRDYARLKRGVTSDDIDARAILRELTTPEERKLKKAEAAAARRAKMTSEQRAAEAARKKRKRRELANRA